MTYTKKLMDTVGTHYFCFVSEFIENEFLDDHKSRWGLAFEKNIITVFEILGKHFTEMVYIVRKCFVVTETTTRFPTVHCNFFDIYLI